MATPVGALAPTRVPAGAPADADGVVVGAGPATIDIYVDFICPFCRRFEEASGPVLAEIAATRVARLVYHPLGLLDRLSTTRYSTRSSAASGCAADHRKFAQYKDLLFAGQPPEGGPGLSDEQLIELGLGLGLDPDFAPCVDGGRYLEWSAYLTARAIERRVEGTPSVFVDGVSVQATAEAIVAALEQRVS